MLETLKSEIKNDFLKIDYENSKTKKTLGDYGVNDSSYSLVHVQVFETDATTGYLKKVSGGTGYPTKFGLTGQEIIIGVDAELNFFVKPVGGNGILIVNIV